MSWPGGRVRAALGRGGVTVDKREGDGATPAGMFALRALWFRPDRVGAPATRLPLFLIGPDAGWCDDPASPHYNRPVTLPFAARHERLWRPDEIYDLVVPVGYNDDPPVAGLGSAIFLHVAHPDYRPTEGCVAVSRFDLETILAGCGPETAIRIRSG